ncbi:miniconductance mechanosensitive channel MscM [Utexia brackfieldae]
MSVFAQSVSNIISQQDGLEQLIKELSERNSELQQEQTMQSEQLSYIVTEKNNISQQISHVQNTLSMLDEQGEWLSFSTALGETLRRQLLSLPEKPKSQPLDQDIANIRVKQLNYHELLDNLSDFPALSSTLAGTPSGVQYRKLLQERRELLQSLSAGGDNLVLELTKLKIVNKQLSDAIDAVDNAAHRYFFWVADVNPISTKYPVELIKDLSLVLFSLDTGHQLLGVSGQIFTTPATVILLLASVVFVILHFRFKTSFSELLANTANRVGKVTQDRFSLTLRVVFYSVLMALPLPVLWAVVGYILQISWDYPIAMALGQGVNAAAPILWVFMISAYFALPNGLFIAHFKWPVAGVRAAMKYYQLSVWVVIPLVMLLMSFDVYNGREFASTIGRLVFILLCFALVFMTNAIHRAGVPMYIDRKGSGDNLLSRILWLILLCAPWIAIVAACLGYLMTAQVLLGRLEASVGIWFGLLVIYFMIRRWMWIQKRKIEFERAKQKRLERIAQRARTDDELNNEAIEEPVVDLDTISSQSLQLVRSILVMIALICMILLWSELHSAFAFMENIKLWTSSVSGPNGSEVDQSITLASVFIAILVMTITVQLVKNLPALLELGILQHLDLTPGTGYALSTLSKYVILMIGCMVAFSFLGIDWSKIQWLIAALGVGLGFGLQEIFANFISGLIILFEKPIRIGDTVTIRDLTGSITKINTRATTIVDWDRKEIVMPNKAFITEQLINWSLSDAITRIVLTVPATINASSETIIDILKVAAQECSYVLDDPEPQIFLVDIQEGIQLFEIRVFAAEMAHRMPLRSEIQQLILDGYRKHDLELPFPPLQTNIEALGRKSGRRIYQSGSL